MPPPKTNRYLVRNRLHQTLGDFSELEILNQIRKSKLSGEDEAALFPGLNWKKISSYPIFYDALIHQALGVKPAEESVPNFESMGSSKKRDVFFESPPKEGPTHVEGVSEPRDSQTSRLGNDRQDATEQLAHAHPILSKNDLEELFPEEGSVDPKALSRPLHHDFEEPVAEVPNQTVGPEKPNRKKILIWGSVGLLTFLLYQSGEPSKEKTGEGLNASMEDARAKSVEIFQEDPEDQKIFLRLSAEQAVQMDVPLGYQEAVGYYRKALEANPQAIELYDGAAMAIARSLEENPTDEALQKLLKKTIDRGRTIEPQRTSFYRAEAVALRGQGKISDGQKQLDLAIETDSLNPENLLIQAEWMVAEGKFEDAQRLLESILSWSQQSVKASYLLAKTLYERQQLESAWALSQKIIQINPVHAPTYVLMGDIFTKKNDLKSAKAFYSLGARFSVMAPKKIAGYTLWRAGNLSELGSDPTEAKQFYSLSYEFSEELHPSLLPKIGSAPSAQEIQSAQAQVLATAPYYERIGQEAMEAKNFERAEGIYLGAVWTYPEIGRLWYRLGEAREALARTREEFRWAASTYEKAIQVAPDEVDAYLKLGLLETAQSNLNKAFVLLQRAEELAPEDPNVQLSLGKHLFSRKDFRAATERLRAARSFNPNLGEVSYYQGMLYKLFDPGNPKAALRHFEEAYSKDPSNYDALAEWLKLKVVTFEKMFAVKFLRNMLSADPKNPNLLWVFGEVYTANQEFNRAVQYYQKALDFDKRDSKIRLSLARALASLGKLDEAIAEFKLSSDLDAKNGEGYFYAAEILFQRREYALARDLLLGLLKVVPSYPGAKRLLAMSYEALSERDLAIAEMTKEVRANPKNYQFLLELSEMFMRNKKYQEAIKELGGVVNLAVEKKVADKRTPSGVRVEPTGLKTYRVKGLVLLSKCYRATNQVEVSEGAVRSALALDPENPEVRLERGYVYNALGRYREAAEDFNYFLSKNGNAPEAGEVKQLLQKSVIEE